MSNQQSPPDGNSKIPCPWEKKEVGCKNISCASFHTKGRYVNGVFLPPSIVSDITSETPRTLDSFRPPIHPPVIINLMDEEDEDDDSEEEEEQNDYKAEQRQLSHEEEEELKAIMAVCYGAGDIYKFPICKESNFQASTPDGHDCNIGRASDTEHQEEKTLKPPSDINIECKKEKTTEQDTKSSNVLDKKRSHKGHNKTCVPVQMYTEPYQKPGRRRPQNWGNKNKQPDATMEKNTDQYQPGTRSPWKGKNETWLKNTEKYNQQSQRWENYKTHNPRQCGQAPEKPTENYNQQSQRWENYKTYYPRQYSQAPEKPTDSYQPGTRSSQTWKNKYEKKPDIQGAKNTENYNQQTQRWENYKTHNPRQYSQAPEKPTENYSQQTQRWENYKTHNPRHNSQAPEKPTGYNQNPHAQSGKYREWRRTSSGNYMQCK